MNSYDEGKQHDSTGKGQDGRGSSADERSENPSEESLTMNDENEYEEAGAAEADRREVRDEGPELTSLLRQTSRLLHRRAFAAAAEGVGDQGQVVRDQAVAAVDDVLSDGELESLTDSLQKIVDALGRRGPDAHDEWGDHEEFASRRGFTTYRSSADRFFGGGRPEEDRVHGFGSRADPSQPREWGPRRGGNSRGRGRRHNVQERPFGRCSDHEERGVGAHGAAPRGRGRRGSGRRRGLGRMLATAFDHGFAAGRDRDAWS